MIINPDHVSTQDMYKLLSGSIVPRPIAWISTVSTDGIYNLAPFSFFTVASRNPPTLAITIVPKSNGEESVLKDTLKNIKDQKELVVNIVTASLANEMQRSSENLLPEADEFEHTGMTAAESEVVKVPRVLEAPINMECKLSDIIQIGEDYLVLAEIVRYHIKDELYNNGRIDLEKLAPIGRLAGNYSVIDTIISLPNEDLEYYLKIPKDLSW